MVKKIHILTGEEAVREYEENGVDGCIKQGHNCVEVVTYDGLSKIEDIIRTVLSRTAGQLASIVISEEDAEKIEEAFK